jgi:hydrogenase maturation protein HypF
MCDRLAQSAGTDRVVLSGGVFQNYFLLDRTVDRLTSMGLRVYTQRSVPTNDGGIALGQLFSANETIDRERGG